MKTPRLMRSYVLLALAYSLIGSLPASAGGPLLTEGVSANGTHVVFGHAGRLWSVSRTGGHAAVLTDGTGEDEGPYFAPDGRRLAFSRRQGGNWDVYLATFDSGTLSEPRRLTHHPKVDWAAGWHESTVLFVSSRDQDRVLRFYSIPARGVFPTPLPLPSGYQGALSPDGTRLVYTPRSRVFSPPYRHYRGGMTSPLWVADLDDSEVEVLGGAEYNHRYPMWVGETIYFTADPDGVFNLYAYDTRSKTRRRLSAYERHGVEAASAHEDGIVYVRDGRIHWYDFASGRAEEIDVELEADDTERRPREVEATRFLTSSSVTDAGTLVLSVRGEILTWDPASGEAQRLTVSSGVAEREGVAAPGGDAVAYFSDASGEYELHVRRPDGTVGKIPVEDRPSFYRQPVWSPDARHVAFTGKRLGLWLADTAGGTTELVDRSSYLAQELYDPSWSADGRYLAYAKATPDHLRHVLVYDLETGERHQITRDVHAMKPVFDSNGKYLHYIASNDALMGAANDVWGLLSAIFYAPVLVRGVHTVVLREGLPAPRWSLTGQPNPEAEAARAASETGIDFEGIGERIVPLPAARRNYVDLRSGGPGEIYLAYQHWPPTPGGRENPSVDLERYRLGEEQGTEEVAEGVEDFTLSADGRTLLYTTGEGTFLRRYGQDEPRQLDLASLKLEVDPSAEWEQMFHEAWRLMRDYFYDPNHHGQDLAELERHYAAYLPQVNRRRDFNQLLSKMLGNVSVSHMSIRGGDAPAPSGGPERTGVLGADFEVHRGHYRITRIYRSGPAYATNALVPAAPLDQPGVEVEEGDYLLAVHEVSIDASKNLYSYFSGTARRPVRITVGPHPDDSRETRTYTVMPLAGDNSVRRANVYESNRRRVEELSGGRLAYVSAPDYGFGGIREFLRGFFAGASKQGYVIDQRFGPGGITSDVLLHLLTRPPLHRYAFPYGEDLTVPTTLAEGPKVVLINEWNGSASETFPLMFKLAKAGTLVGKRTLGGGVGGALNYPRLIDGGRITIPNRAAYDPEDGAWLENRGVAPDVEVELWPSAWRQGLDEQLDKAIEVALSQLETEDRKAVVRPAYPVHP